MIYHDYLSSKYFDKDGNYLNEVNHPIQTSEYNALETQKDKDEYIKQFSKLYSFIDFFNDYWSGNVYDSHGLKLFTRHTSSQIFAEKYQQINNKLVEKFIQYKSSQEKLKNQVNKQEHKKTLQRRRIRRKDLPPLDSSTENVQNMNSDIFQYCSMP